MKAREIIINVPISISINQDGEVSVNGEADEKEVKKNDSNVEDSTSMVFPLEQELELRKAALGKSSDVITRLLKDE